MSFFNYKKAAGLYSSDSFMMNILSCYQDMDEYHLLRDADSLNEINMDIRLPRSADAYRKWLQVCDGGLLFSTTLLSRSAYDVELDISFPSLAEVNKPENYATYGLPDGYFIIALFNYGAPVCLSENDEKVYLWNLEECYFETIWDTLADYLADEYNTAVRMLEDGVLKPIPIKIKETGHE